MIPVVIVDLGIAIAFFGTLAIVHPIPRLLLATRAQGALALLGGAMLVVIGCLLPASESRVANPRSRLDAFVPSYQFNEVHRIHIAAPPERVYRSMREVRAGEIFLFKALTTIRRFGRPGPESILNAPDEMPILDVATQTTFVLLADDPPREYVSGTVVEAPQGWRRSAVKTPEAFKALDAPGFALAAINFLVEPDGHGGTLLSTETRVHATDAAARRHFAAYWRIIYPGSSTLRWTWLRAVRRRAERM
jgi:hypothetical protein